MTDCNDEKLKEFSLEHYTYINQIFGDLTIREIIMEINPRLAKKTRFEVEETGSEFENSYHHILKNQKTEEIICSVYNGYQDLDVNQNDTLCQSYSLLTFFEIPIDSDQKQRQMDMISMYLKLLTNKRFIKALSEVIIPENHELWIDYVESYEKPEPVYLIMDKENILMKIKETLEKWKQYGYWYFIGNGKCNDEMVGGKKSKIMKKNKTKKNISKKIKPKK
jgi:hypothetical protein